MEALRVALAGRSYPIHIGAGMLDDAALYAPHVVQCSPREHAAFVGNAIALTTDTVWMSAQAERALEPAHRDILAAAGFAVASVELDAIEAGGGSLRCCVGEVF